MREQPLTRRERRALGRTAVKAYVQQPHMVEALAGVAAGAFPPGTLTIAHIAHDDWCPALQGGLCRCEPDITYERVD